MEHHSHTHSSIKQPNQVKLALQLTLHCLLGCGLGEIAGMIISTVFTLPNFTSVVISIVFGFAGGLLLGIVPLIRNGMQLTAAVRIVIISEGLSIAVMEIFELITQVVIPGVMNAGLSDMIFWIGMIAGLAVGFIAAFPVNLYLVKKGVTHHHS